MHDGSKGSFWDRLRLRFRKILMQIKKLRKKNLEKNPFEEERLLKKKKEEELYNYYRMQNKKGLSNNKSKVINKSQVKIQPKKVGIEINTKKSNKDIQKQAKLKDMSINNTKIIITPTNLKKKTITVNGMNNIINNTKTKSKDNINNVNKSISSNTNMINEPKSKNIVTVKQNVEPFKRIGNANKFSLKRKNKFNTVTNTKSNTSKKSVGIAPTITKIVNKVSPKKIKEQKEIKKAFSIKEIDLSKFNKVNTELDKKLEKQKEIGEKLSKLVKEIEPQKQIEVRYHFINNMFSNLKNLFLSVMSIPLLKRPKNIPLFSVGLFLFNNSIRNMRKMVTKDEYIRFIPSDTYTDAIKENINNFELIDYMIDDSLDQIASLRYEYSHEFSKYSETKQFKETIQKLNNYENTLKEKQKKVLKEKEQMNIVLDKNCKKLQLIKDMNK